MTMMNPASMPARSGIAGLYEGALRLAGTMPLSVVQLAARLAVANVFWQSSQSKLASWPVTVDDAIPVNGVLMSNASVSPRSAVRMMFSSPFATRDYPRFCATRSSS